MAPMPPAETKSRRLVCPETCRNLVWEISPEEGERRPGRYCLNRLGPVHILDCPLTQGLECRLYEPRPEGEEPRTLDDDGLDDLRGELTLDYLRWPYWKRVRALRETGCAEEPIRVEPVPDEEDEEEADAAAALSSPGVPEEAGEALREKYPGQRRSEDRLRARRREAPRDRPAPSPPGKEPGPEPEGKPPGETGKPGVAPKEKPPKPGKKGERRRSSRGRRRRRRRK